MRCKAILWSSNQIRTAMNKYAHVKAQSYIHNTQIQAQSMKYFDKKIIPLTNTSTHIYLHENI